MSRFALFALLSLLAPIAESTDDATALLQAPMNEVENVDDSRPHLLKRALTKAADVGIIVPSKIVDHTKDLVTKASEGVGLSKSEVERNKSPWNDQGTPQWKCKEVKVQKGFNLDKYVIAPWYVQFEKPLSYGAGSTTNCVRTQYMARKDGMPEFSNMETKFANRVFSKVNGWDLFISNQAWDTFWQNEEDTLGYTCGKHQRMQDPAKLEVAPCFMPAATSSDYWVAAHDEVDGFAVIVGGQTDHPTTMANAQGLCGYKDGTLKGERGMWIVTRNPFPSPVAMAKAWGVMKENGIDTSTMRQVQHAGCRYGNTYKNMTHADLDAHPEKAQAKHLAKHLHNKIKKVVYDKKKALHDKQERLEDRRPKEGMR